MYESNEFETLTPEYEYYEPCEDCTEVLLKKYETKKSRKADDIFAMQALLCVLLGAAGFLANILIPDTFSPIYEHLRQLISDEKEILPDIIGLVTGH